jgi:spermidine/putrescine transport system substrate-binding protein
MLMQRLVGADPRGLITPTRRQLIAGAVAFGAAAVLTGSRFADAQENVLNILSWPGHADPEAVKPFEDKHGVKVVAKEYVGGDAMLALINQSPPGSFDVVLSDVEYNAFLREGGFIDPLNPADYPIEDFWPQFQKFEGNWHHGQLYSVLLRFGYLGLSYRTDLVAKEDAGSYANLWDPKVKGKVGLFDWYLPSLGAISLYDGNKPPFDISDVQFAKVKKTLFSLKPQVSGFYSMADVFSSLTNGTAAIIPGIGEWITLLLQRNGVPVASVVPKEGGVQWAESLSIASSSRKKDLAKAFIQYMTSPEGQVRTALLPSYNAAIPSKKGWDKLIAEHPKDAKLLRMTFSDRNVIDEYNEGRIFVRKIPVRQEIEVWNDTWTEFKSS